MMKAISAVEKNLVKENNMQVEVEYSPMARFIKFLIKIYFLPLDYDSKSGLVSFKIWSINFLFHALFYLVPFVAINVTMFSILIPIADELKTLNSTSVELISLFSSFIVHFSLLFPIILRFKIQTHKKLKLNMPQPI